MYNFVYRRRFSPLKTTLPSTVGHSYDPQTDKMWVVHSSGTGQEIMRWKDCEVFLAADWQAFADKFCSKIGRPTVVK